jgi:hypothetical protein
MRDVEYRTTIEDEHWRTEELHTTGHVLLDALEQA